ncbi:MAG: SRPBCC family protein [Actinobacteria bacterium]|nr:SRPBCC family protein [Actinomycetota bacterium]
MWEASETIDVGAPPEAVWAVVADIEGHTRLAGSGEVKAIRMSGPPGLGTRFEGDIEVGVVGSFVAQCEIAAWDPPSRLAWKSWPPLDEGETSDHQIEVNWEFLLTPHGEGTRVEHRFSVPPPKAGAEELADFLERTNRIDAVRAGMRQTLENLRVAVES